MQMKYIERMIVFNRWGYGQTNIDFYRIIKRTPHFVTLQKLGWKMEGKMNGFMQGACMPDRDMNKGEPIKKKVYEHEGEEAINFEYGWGYVWDGEPVAWTGYY